MDCEILFYALKQLEFEIEQAKNNKDYQVQNELETKYSYWKQLMATYESEASDEIR